MQRNDSLVFDTQLSTECIQQLLSCLALKDNEVPPPVYASASPDFALAAAAGDPETGREIVEDECDLRGTAELHPTVR